MFPDDLHPGMSDRQYHGHRDEIADAVRTGKAGPNGRDLQTWMRRRFGLTEYGASGVVERFWGDVDRHRERRAAEKGR